jgi:hypothetical protein
VFSDVETKLLNTYINMRLPMVKSVHMKVIKQNVIYHSNITQVTGTLYVLTEVTLTFLLC